MLISKFFILFFLCSPFLAITHPFYKTMPQEVEHIYDELKAQEQEAIEAFKKAYPKIPAYVWDNVHFLQRQTQTWLRDTASENTITTQEPVLIYNRLDNNQEAIKEYCRQYIEHECNVQGIDDTKIDFKTQSLDENAIGIAIGHEMILEKSWKLPHYKGRCCYNIDSTKPCTIIIDPSKFINNSTYLKKRILKHEIAHLTEAHASYPNLIRNSIAIYYGISELEKNEYLTLMTNLQKAKELMADILPALLSPSFADEYLNNIRLSEQGDTTHPNGKTITKWLIKIHHASLIYKVKSNIAKFLSFFS